jgi:molybdopterin/thiamine biosynthesis adenylyltransferase
MKNMTDEIFMRNYGIIDDLEQKKLSLAKVTVVGAGGVGGITLISLARMGIGNIHVIDMDKFELSNINRQMFSSVSRVNLYKAECAKETLLDINPSLNIKVTIDKLNEENAEELFCDSDVIIDATDNLVSRVIIHRIAQKMKIPSVWIAVTPPFRGGVMCFNELTPPYEVVLSHPSYLKKLTEEVKLEINEIKNKRAMVSSEFGALKNWAVSFVEKKSPWAVLCPVANMVGLLASFEAFKFIIRRDNLLPTMAPNLIKINLAELEMVKVMTPTEGVWDNALL